MVDTMRKLAKKREATALKQANAAQLAAMRKANEQPSQRNVFRTPQEFSKLKYEQNERMKEQYAQLQQRQQAQQRVWYLFSLVLMNTYFCLSLFLEHPFDHIFTFTF
jgi:chromatin modification-related protein VID21